MEGGGTAIYIHEEFESNLLISDSFESCEIVAIYIEKLNTINIVIYRPPDAGSLAFNKVIDKTKTLLENMDKPEPNVIITGDFNFQFVKWNRGIHGGCRWEKRVLQ